MNDLQSNLLGKFGLAAVIGEKYFCASNLGNNCNLSVKFDLLPSGPDARFFVTGCLCPTRYFRQINGTSRVKWS